MRRFARPGGTWALAVILLAAPASAAAQQWSLEGQMGRLDFRLAPDAPPAATSLAVGLGYDAPDTRFRLTTGLPTGDDEPLWASLDSWRRAALQRGMVTVGLDLSAQAFAQRYTATFEETIGTGPFQRPVITEGVTHGYGVAGQVMPLLGLRHGPLGGEARIGMVGYQGGLGAETTARRVTTADLRLTFNAPALVLGGDARWFATPEGDRAYAGVTALLARSSGALWAAVGHWIDEPDAVRPWAAGASLRLSDRFDLTTYVRQDDVDPVFGTAPKRYWGAGLRVGLTPPPQPARPVPAAYVGGVATIELRDARSDSPSIAGDFNGWTPEPMTRRGGAWVYTASLGPGVYEYAFVDTDGTWYVPTSVPGRRDDGMGGHVAILVVEEPGS